MDVLFLALNPPVQSNSNGHYFSGDSSRFFELLFLSGLITKRLPKLSADEVVFGSTAVNHAGASFGVMDLVDDLVETQSSRVKATPIHVERAVARIRELEPGFVCVIHSKVRDALNRYGGFTQPLTYGMCGQILPGSTARFVLNYFPNGNSIADAPKLEIFRTLRDSIASSRDDV